MKKFPSMQNNQQPVIIPYTLQASHSSLAQLLRDSKSIFDTLDVSDVTRQDYKARIHLFISFIRKYGLDRNTFLSFKQYLGTRKSLSVATKSKYLTTARVFLKELNRRGYLNTDITQNIKGFSQIKKHRRLGFTDLEVSQVLKTVNKLDSSPKNVRLKAFVTLLAFQGLRQIEITRLDVDDINLVNNTALVLGKGKDDKELIHLHPQTAEALHNHIVLNKVKRGALFVSLGNKPSGRIKTVTIRREIMRLIQPLGINKTPHGFRHFYVTTLLKNLPIRDVRKFSRHSSLEMLIVYDDEIDMTHKAQEVFACFSSIPLDRRLEKERTV